MKGSLLQKNWRTMQRKIIIAFCTRKRERTPLLWLRQETNTAKKGNEGPHPAQSGRKTKGKPETHRPHQRSEKIRLKSSASQLRLKKENRGRPAPSSSRGEDPNRLQFLRKGNSSVVTSPEKKRISHIKGGKITPLPVSRKKKTHLPLVGRKKKQRRPQEGRGKRNAAPDGKITKELALNFFGQKRMNAVRRRERKKASVLLNRRGSVSRLCGKKKENPSAWSERVQEEKPLTSCAQKKKAEKGANLPYKTGKKRKWGLSSPESEEVSQKTIVRQRTPCRRKKKK